METVSSREEEALPEYGLEFDGNFRGLLPIVLVNLLLTIITLGLYRFWARTKVRKYLWGSVRLHGDAFEYTGTGKELFIGFLIVLFLVFLPLGFVFFQAQIMMETRGREARGGGLCAGGHAFGPFCRLGGRFPSGGPMTRSMGSMFQCVQ